MKMACIEGLITPIYWCFSALYLRPGRGAVTTVGIGRADGRRMRKARQHQGHDVPNPERQTRDRVARPYGRGKGPFDAEVGGAGQEVAGCRSRLRRASDGHFQLYGKPWFSVYRMSVNLIARMSA